ncbi:hypothetical protein [Varunaivibrio sulfuroxidans]|uniref:Lipoprotein n=1 Tax=Varunaivibrio sulfuroxidans TaxID=1773489 RepID=A0A4R3JAY4_9PROT|nr:hypothetical protein [Varunaivibrio sulfuroxidans]TCS63169.1 hypothetical protein EDD55_104263 [Varunaivibrio sulfuroxidans]WES31769.1 hypothetical protein P3M64_05250 [Varunaivibrio sulfuroxidans]
MKTNIAISRLAVFGFLILGACAQTTPLTPSATPNGTTADAGGKNAARQTPPKDFFNRFPDIPIPSGIRLDGKQTMVFGAGDSWFGKIAMFSTFDSRVMYNFYKEKLPAFGWREITSVRGNVSILTSQRGQRVLSVQISDASLRGSNIILTVSPHEGAERGAPTR